MTNTFIEFMKQKLFQGNWDPDSLGHYFNLGSMFECFGIYEKAFSFLGDFIASNSPIVKLLEEMEKGNFFVGLFS